MGKQILLPLSVQKELNTEHKCSENELRRALNYQRNSKRAKMLRVAALERGGLIYTSAHAPSGYCPNVDTRHDHAKRVMSQMIGERVELQVSRDRNTATIIIDGEEVATFDGMTISSWGDVLYSLQQVYNQLIA